MLLERVSPLIRDLHGKLLKGASLPFEIGPEVIYKPRERLYAEQDAISSKMTKIYSSCLPSSLGFNLPECFYHIIDAIYAFPYAPELVQVASYLSRELDFSNISAELSFILLDAIRTVYKEEFLGDNPTHPFITSFAPKLDWSYRPARRSYRGGLRGIRL